MALQIKNDGPNDEPSREYYGSSWMESTTARDPKDGDSGEPEFNPELEFDVVKPQGGMRQPRSAPPTPDRRYDSVPEGSGVRFTLDVKMIKLIITAIFLIFIPAIIYKTVISPKAKDLTPFVQMYESLDAQVDGDFERAEKMDKYVPQYTRNRKIEVYSGDEIYPIFIDGKYAGVQLAEKKWSLYGVRVGMGEADAVKKTTYPYEASMSVINDMAEGKSTSYFYYNKRNNDCLVMTVSGTTNRISALTYYNDYNMVTETLESLSGD